MIVFQTGVTWWTCPDLVLPKYLRRNESAGEKIFRNICWNAHPSNLYSIWWIVVTSQPVWTKSFFTGWEQLNYRLPSFFHTLINSQYINLCLISYWINIIY